MHADMAKLYIILDSYDPQWNSQIQVSVEFSIDIMTVIIIDIVMMNSQNEDDYTALINSVFQCKYAKFNK